MIRKLINWVAARFGLTTLADADVKAARQELKSLQEYAKVSGALNHPKRIHARSRVILSSAKVLGYLS